MSATAILEPQAPSERPEAPRLLGHPVGLAYLGFSEAWERFSYYGMQALLGLYMVDRLLLPGHIEHIAGFAAFRHALETVYGPLAVQPLGSAVFGLYTGLVWLTPIFGGLLADRLLGRTRTVIIGALLMAAGHFLMAFEGPFLLALLCLVLGVGGFKGNLASQVGDLYAPGDMRRADGFQIYYIFINVGVIAAPLVCGTLGETVGWHWGFGAAGVGMLVGLGVYLAGRKWMPADARGARAAASPAKAPPMSARDRRALTLLVLLLPVLAIGAVGNQEIFNAYMVWAQDHARLVLFGHRTPTTWLVTLDSITSFSFLVGAVAFWRLWARRFPEPDELTKIAIGLAVSVLGMLWLAFLASRQAATGQPIGLWSLALFHVLNSIGFANVFPVSMALYARASPKAVAATMMGVFYLQFFGSNMLVGWLGGFLSRMPTPAFWLTHAALIATAAVIFAAVRVLFRKTLAPQAAAPLPA